MENNEKDKQVKEALEKAAAKQEAIKAVKKLSTDSKWFLTQEILQEIQAGYTVVDPDKLPPVTQMIEDLKKEVEARYSDDPDIKEVILESIPGIQSVRAWLKKEGWDEAVWKKVRADKLFSSDKRAQVIESLRLRAIERSDVAAKIWLTLSGDYSEKDQADNKTIDAYREINSILHSKKSE